MSLRLAEPSAAPTTCSVPLPEGTHRQSFVAEPTLGDPAGAGVDDETVRVDRAGDDGLAEARTGVHHRRGPSPVTGSVVNSTPATAASTISCTTTASRTAAVVNAVDAPVADRAVSPQRGPATADAVEHRIDAHQVQVGVLLAGEARVGQVLGRRRRRTATGTPVHASSAA